MILNDIMFWNTVHVESIFLINPSLRPLIMCIVCTVSTWMLKKRIILSLILILELVFMKTQILPMVDPFR